LLHDLSTRCDLFLYYSEHLQV